jgi:hypothetical protein
MDEFDHSHHQAGAGIGLTSVLTIFASALSLFVCLVSFSEIAQIGPVVGEMISFDPRNGPRYWSQPGIPALTVPAGGRRQVGQPRQCILMPSVMAASGGSLVIEAKEMTQPPLFRVHWSGPHTDLGAGDCGRSADLTLQLVQLRALANVAGGYGPGHVHGLF